MSIEVYAFAEAPIFPKFSNVSLPSSFSNILCSKKCAIPFGTSIKSASLSVLNLFSREPYLVAKAAYVVGAGLVQIYTHEDNRMILQQLLPEAIITTYQEYDGKQLEALLGWADVIGIGSGLGTSNTSEKLVSYVMENCEKTCIVDADALNIISKNPHILRNKKAKCIFTPHMKEMSRLTGKSVNEIIEQRIEILKSYVETNDVICALKDARTFVADGSDKIYLNLSGNSAMAKGGSGDVLTGIISGIAAQGATEFEAASLGVYLHGLTGDIAREKKGSYSVLASDLVDSISKILKEI